MLTFMLVIIGLFIVYCLGALGFAMLPDYSPRFYKVALYIENSFKLVPESELDYEKWIDSCVAWPFHVVIRLIHLSVIRLYRKVVKK